MTALAPHLTAFFQERLAQEQRVSVHTSDSYAYAFKLLLDYAWFVKPTLACHDLQVSWVLMGQSVHCKTNGRSENSRVDIVRD